MSLKSNRGPRGDEKRVLVVDDEADIRELLDLTLVRMGLMTDCAASVGEAMRKLENGHFHLCLTDMRMPDGDGLELVRHIGEHIPELPVAVITAHGSAENAVSALKAGAFDYIAKPVSLEQLRGLVKSALRLPDQAAKTEATTVECMLGASAARQQIRTLINKVSRSHAPVHITGESGSGKELAARLIHAQSNRRDQAFVPVNCGAIPDSLVESEFFGYRKGAFSGATEDREGFFQAAHGGTLFLDEIAELPLAMQVKLLRAIQEKMVRKVGATSEEPADVRIICATHQDLKALADAGRFRQDLFYRLNVIELRMPSLRECPEDIPLLTDHILKRLSAESGLAVPVVTPAARSALLVYSYPGNVRELENILERAMALLGGDAIDSADLNLQPVPAMMPEQGEGLLQDHLDRVERQRILEAIARTGGNRTKAARLLGVTFRSLRYRMERLGIRDREE